MMAVLKKRSTAVLVAVIVIVFGTLLGVHLSVNRETAKIEAMFFNGVTVTDSVTKSTYVQPSIQSQLDKRATAALGLWTIASASSDITVSNFAEALKSARNELLDAKNIFDKYTANEKLQTSYKNLYAALVNNSLAVSQKTAFDNYTATLDGAQGVINKSAYNSQVSAFMKTLDTLPVTLFKNLAFVTYPEYFGAEG